MNAFSKTAVKALGFLLFFALVAATVYAQLGRVGEQDCLRRVRDEWDRRRHRRADRRRKRPALGSREASDKGGRRREVLRQGRALGRVPFPGFRFGARTLLDEPLYRTKLADDAAGEAQEGEVTRGRRESGKPYVPIQEVGLGPDDVLSSSTIFDLQGRFKVASGDSVEYMHRARKLMGTDVTMGADARVSGTKS
jgi:hypothetical protein